MAACMRFRRTSENPLILQTRSTGAASAASAEPKTMSESFARACQATGRNHKSTRLEGPQDLGNVMLQMADVIAHEVLESRGLVPRHGLPCDFVKVVTGPRPLPSGCRHRLDHSGEMEVEEAPQPDEVRPRGSLIALRRYPRLLLVTRKHEIVHELGADKALMVVRGGIDQVADDLLRGPLARGRRFRRIPFRDG